MYSQFDRQRLKIKPLSDRVHDLTRDTLLALDEPPGRLEPEALEAVQTIGRRMAEARARGSTVLWLAGGHLVRAGVARQVIDLMQRGLITVLGMNGAGPIHDFELALVGATCESVARYVRSGEFGLWKETARLNDVVAEGAADGLGLGEAIGREIAKGDYPFKETSILAAAWRLGVPVTVHVGIGYDILHEHPNFDPAAFGVASYQDFLTLANALERLERGAFLSFGTAVMGPEVYLKALTMARNVAHQEGREIRHFTTGVFDLVPLVGDLTKEAARSDFQYYFRPWKTILVRTVADGGESFYVRGDHRSTVPQIRRAAING